MAVVSFSTSNIAIFKLISGGAVPYDIVLPFEADMIEWWNNSAYGTDNENTSGMWTPLLSDAIGGGLVINRGTTDLTSDVLTTTGVTELPDGTGYAATLLIPTVISAGPACVVTVVAHGLVTGQSVRATDFRASPVAIATGMYSLNNQIFDIRVLTADTFQLYVYGTGLLVPFSTVGQVAYVSNGVARFNLVGQKLYTENPEPVFTYTLGTAVMGNDGDVLIIRATKANQVADLGNVG